MFKETVYLNVAKRKSDEQLLDEHWRAVRLSKIWFSNKTGVETPFEELDNHHLQSIIKMLCRFLEDRQSKEIVKLLSVLVDELTNRMK